MQLKETNFFDFRTEQRLQKYLAVLCCLFCHFEHTIQHLHALFLFLSLFMFLTL